MKQYKIILLIKRRKASPLYRSLKAYDKPRKGMNSFE